jgi:DNA invertase Pin-like site-specific DNA recombinase
MTIQPTRTTSTIFTQLPLITSVAIYARPPLGREEEEGTTHTQVYTLVQYALSLGYTPDQLTIFADRETAETTLENHERYQALLTAIKNGSVSVVFLSDIQGLFAEAQEEEVNKFMHLCMAKGVFVVTDEKVYDFSNLTLVHQFRVDSTGNRSVFLVS